eukprot:GHRR01001322.1.p4 GENE.GHRR01001322.1~~GHRR01001322.1.p4  ORF type:complete len:102 (-),score=15.63 GHRR01001322.1:1643-1948(-)
MVKARSERWLSGLAGIDAACHQLQMAHCGCAFELKTICCTHGGYFASAILALHTAGLIDCVTARSPLRLLCTAAVQAAWLTSSQPRAIFCICFAYSADLAA